MCYISVGLFSFKKFLLEFSVFGSWFYICFYFIMYCTAKYLFWSFFIFMELSDITEFLLDISELGNIFYIW